MVLLLIILSQRQEFPTNWYAQIYNTIVIARLDQGSQPKCRILPRRAWCVSKKIVYLYYIVYNNMYKVCKYI